MHVSERINLIINHLKLNKNSFSKAIGLSNNVTIGKIVNDKRSPSFEVLTKIIQTFDCINSHWLLTGQGNMLLNQDNKSVNKDLNLGSLDSLDLGEPKDSLDFYKKMHDQQANVIEGYQEQVIIAMKQLDENDIFIRKLLKKIKDLKEELNHYKGLINDKKLNG